MTKHRLPHGWAGLPRRPGPQPRAMAGRDDGAGADNLRRPRAVHLDPDRVEPGDVAFVGFRSDEGVSRNKGRRGAAAGPGALRRARASMALPGPLRAPDAGDVEVGDLANRRAAPAAGACARPRDACARCPESYSPGSAHRWFRPGGR
ncbi:hypothetical protein ACFWOJ_05670 [Streptomyces sp. NPDC058439]|uniref:hypothetical protein n=1 Tax=Streptomyces sp. NPDC058439 TaxID=3346500 RepID=UPI00364F359B